jgi:hypothetical protein
MKVRLAYIGAAVVFLVGLAVLLIVSSGPTLAQKEVTSKIYRYRERVATGYYEGYEVSPRRKRAVLAVPGVRRGLFPFGSSSATVRIRTRLPDSHRGLKFYYRNTCIECHPQQARNIHSVRAGITCRQCHGPEPIAAINHYYSAMNPLRRHAYVCAKCHEGANAAFAGFYVHEPAGTALSTRESFPVLFYASWGMLLLLLGTLAFFVPHSFMVGVRELFENKSLENLIKKQVFPIFQSIKERAFSIIYSLRAGLRKFFEKKKAAENEAEDAP